MHTDLLIMNCRECYSKKDFAVPLKENGSHLFCPICGSKYNTSKGELIRL
ncbi:MAG: hypothetical protein ABH803_03855 [Candidatus Micrarchaeota archaeon]